jgi:phosphate transport system substrate-binding protein
MVRRDLALRVFIAFILTLHTTNAALIVRLTGEENMKLFGERLTEWYSKKSPSLQFAVSSARGADGFAALASGKAEIVQSARLPLHAEDEALRSAQGKKYFNLQVATEIAGISLNASNPVKDISLFQLRQVLSGSVKNWKQLGGKDAAIVIYGRDHSCDVASFLEDEFMGDASISPSARLFPTNSALLSALGQDPNGIAFSTVESRPVGKVRYLGIKASDHGEAVFPDGNAIRSKRYKLMRPLYFCFAGTPSGDLFRFAQWILSPEGQLVVEAVGYYPLSGSEREAGTRELFGK